MFMYLLPALILRSTTKFFPFYIISLSGYYGHITDTRVVCHWTYLNNCYLLFVIFGKNEARSLDVAKTANKDS